ncbi:MAG: HAD-IB family phosphatase [Rhodospirillaceae bacterium]
MKTRAGPGIAIFDFDDTLIEGDSMPRFLDAAIGLVRTRLAMIGAVVGALAVHAVGRPRGADFAGSVKALLLRATLAGLAVEDAHAAARCLKPRLRWRSPQLEALRAHAAAGRRVVVASGALDVYLPILLEGLPVNTIMATGIEVRNGHLTGLLKDINCVRQAKAERIRRFLIANAPTGPTWGYGNRPHDLPMLALVDHPTVV